jgi:hypothetical protein
VLLYGKLLTKKYKYIRVIILYNNYRLPFPASTPPACEQSDDWGYTGGSGTTKWNVTIAIQHKKFL